MTRLRCAIYTRKSSEEGLDQSFNSLDAQREACEAYVASQKGEGWVALPAHYDDGGYSGGNMERPALQRLLGDIAAERVDVVIVYKVDRLTRSLADFAKIVEVFDRHGVSFVSVTQAFNTTSSMGRLTLNVLLSFAQFEREVTGERIRDKIAASKAKGMWMGGLPPLGYEPKDRKLIIVPEEAGTVRQIFARYLEVKSVNALEEELRRRGVCSKVRRFRNGKMSGGGALGRGALFHLLRNRLYLGEIVHKDQSYPGEHEAIIDCDLFDRVQKQLATNSVQRTQRQSVSAPLRGKIFDAVGNRMSPSHAYGKFGRRYRYYISAAENGPTNPAPDCLPRVSAALVEQLVLDCARNVLQEPAASWPELLPAVRKVEVHARSLIVELMPPRKAIPADLADAILERLSDGTLRVTIGACMQPRGGTSSLTAPVHGAKRRYDQQLIVALKRAHRELEKHGISFSGNAANLSDARGLSDPYLRKIASLAFLAPDIQAAILNGRQPPWVTLKQLTTADFPTSWSEQRMKLGIN